MESLCASKGGSPPIQRGSFLTPRPRTGMGELQAVTNLHGKSSYEEFYEMIFFKDSSEIFLFFPDIIFSRLAPKLEGNPQIFLRFYPPVFLLRNVSPRAFLRTDLSHENLFPPCSCAKRGRGPNPHPDHLARELKTVPRPRVPLVLKQMENTFGFYFYFL